MPKIQESDNLLSFLTLLAFFRKTTEETIENFPDQENLPPFLGQLLVWLEHASISAANAHPSSPKIIHDACIACVRNVQTGSPYEWQGAWKWNTPDTETDPCPKEHFIPVGWLDQAGGKEDNFVEEVCPDPPTEKGGGKEDNFVEEVCPGPPAEKGGGKEDNFVEEVCPGPPAEKGGGWNVVVRKNRPAVLPQRPQPMELIWRGTDFMTLEEKIYGIIGNLQEFRPQTIVEVKNYKIIDGDKISIRDGTEVTKKVFEGTLEKFKAGNNIHMKIVTDTGSYEASDSLIEEAGLWDEEGKKVKFTAFQKLDSFNDYKISRKKNSGKFFYPSVSEIIK